MKPYWQSPDGAIIVYHGRMEDALAAGVVDVRRVALVHADPPYGIALDTKARSGGRIVGTGTKPSKARGWARIVGDDGPFDPAPIVSLARPSVLWGAHNYADKLPNYPSWLIWDKRDGTTPDDSGDCEIAWSNIGGPIREFRHLWRGLVRASENGGKGGSGPHLHPTQKPIALSTWVFQRAKLKAGDLVFVPYLGSGPDLPAARAAGLRVVACEVERAYCDTAIARLGAITAERAAEPVGSLFAPRGFA